jgi:hypothetical protein
MFLPFQSLPSLLATETEWRRMLGPRFPAFKALCLESSSYEVHSVVRPRRCGCDHRVIRRHDAAGAVGVCRCRPAVCPDLPLTPDDFTALQVSRPRLGYALCQAFGLAVRQAGLPIPNTFQFGAWSSDAVPAVLTIQAQKAVFRRAVAELAAQLRQPFILFAPTSDFLDAPARAILQNYGAEFFPLNTTVVLTENGTLQPTRPPGELFARFTPQPKEIESDAATRAFALVERLDTEKPLPHPSLLTVFRLYCMKELSSVRIARDCKCNKSTVVRRLALLRRRIGVDPRELRRFSPQLAKLEDSLRDSRASRLDPRDYLDDPS